MAIFYKLSQSAETFCGEFLLSGKCVVTAYCFLWDVLGMAASVNGHSEKKTKRCKYIKISNALKLFQ